MGLVLSNEEESLKTTVRAFAERELSPRAAKFDELEEFPYENIAGICQIGIMGLSVDQYYGGAGRSAQQVAIAIEEIARSCAATSAIYLTHLSLGAESIIRYGNANQRAQYLPKLASGELLGAFGLTEPSSGSDAANMQTLATKDHDGYLLNGTKTFISNAPEADLLVIFASTDPDLKARGISAFLVEKGTPGLEVTPMRGKLGMRASTTGTVLLQDCHVPASSLLGEEGQGFSIAMAVLDSSRISVAAQAVGIGQAALDSAVSYSQIRETFGKPIAEHQAIQFMLADMATKLDAARLLTRRAAMLKDAGLAYSKEAAMAKLYASEAAHYACDRALQIHGGSGYFRNNPVERYYRDVRVTEIYEGTSEIQRLVIARNLLRDDVIERNRKGS